jgi:hypothetical protein
MKPLYTPNEFNEAKSRNTLPFECEYCRSTFYSTKNEIQKSIKRQEEGNRRRNDLKYCSKKCSGLSKITGLHLHCEQCKKTIYKQRRNISKNRHHFCSSSCAATYSNTHKTTGYRRSKLEIWIEEQLTKKYPTLPIRYNKTDVINAELDIFIPSLKLAFELNGIFHYEDIYGTLNKIQKNDSKKFQKCIELGIGLCVIDVSHQNRFTEKSSAQFLDIIYNIIDQKMGWYMGNDPIPQASQA